MISQQPREAGLIERVTPMLQRRKQPQRQWCLSSALVKQGRWQPGPKHEAFDSLVAQRVKHLPAMTETWAQSLGQEDPLEKKKATHSSTLAWKIPWTEKPGRLQSIGSQRATSLSLSFYLHLVQKSSSTDAQLGLLPMLEHVVTLLGGRSTLLTWK